MISSPPEIRASLILRLPDAADAAAWDELVAIYGPLVFRLALRQGLQAADAMKSFGQDIAEFESSAQQLWNTTPEPKPP